MAVKRLEKINSELLSEKKNFIDLKAKLIEKRDEELVLLKLAVAEVKSVQGVVLWRDTHLARSKFTVENFSAAT